MAIRREPRSPGSHSLPNGDYRAIVKMSESVDTPVTISYLRFLAGNPGKFGWRPSPENTAVALVPDASPAPNLESGRELAKATLARLASGALVVEERPFEHPIKPELIQTLEHPAKLLKALVLRWPNEFEVRTIGHMPNGYAMPVGTPSISTDPDNEWGRLDSFERLLADSEEEAIGAAQDELARLAASDLPIKDR